MASPTFTVQRAHDSAHDRTCTCTWCGKPATAVPAVVGVAARTPLICSECVGMVNAVAAPARPARPAPVDPAARAEAERAAAEVAERFVALIGDRDPNEVFRCSYCDAHRSQRRKLVPAMTTLAFICDRCGSAARTALT